MPATRAELVELLRACRDFLPANDPFVRRIDAALAEQPEGTTDHTALATEALAAEVGRLKGDGK